MTGRSGTEGSEGYQVDRPHTRDAKLQTLRTLRTRFMKARRAGICPRCKGPVSVGQRIARHEGIWIHLACVPVVAQLRKPSTEEE